MSTTRRISLTAPVPDSLRREAIPASCAFEPQVLFAIQEASVVLALDANGYVAGVLHGASVCREHARGREAEFPGASVIVFTVRSRGVDLPRLGVAVSSVKGDPVDEWFPPAREGEIPR